MITGASAGFAFPEALDRRARFVSGVAGFGVESTRLWFELEIQA